MKMVDLVYHFSISFLAHLAAGNLSKITGFISRCYRKILGFFTRK